MTPFQPAYPIPEQVERTVRELLAQGMQPNQVVDVIMDIHSQEIWLNDCYQVNLRRFDTPAGPMAHLSIKRLDKEPIHDWRDLQQIKNELIGPECEAVELYPAESRLVDSANQFHLWVLLDSSIRFPFGFSERMTSEDLPYKVTGGRQRPRPTKSESNDVRPAVNSDLRDYDKMRDNLTDDEMGHVDEWDRLL